jgi:hypothetical protein
LTILLSEKYKRRFESKYIQMGEDDCWEWIACKYPSGYGCFSGSEHYAHRVSYCLYIGSIPKGVCVLHHCDNPSCVNPNHLFLGLQADNVRDMLQKNRRGDTRVYGNRNGARIHPEIRQGENNGSSVLTELSVVEIRKLYTRDRYHHSNIRQLSTRFGVSRSTIKSIVASKSWKHI